MAQVVQWGKKKGPVSLFSVPFSPPLLQTARARRPCISRLWLNLTTNYLNLALQTPGRCGLASASFSEGLQMGDLVEVVDLHLFLEEEEEVEEVLLVVEEVEGRQVEVGVVGLQVVVGVEPPQLNLI